MAKRRRTPVSPPPQPDENTFDSLFFDPSDSPPGRPVQRNAANARERARMRVLSRAFTRLKTSLPWVPEDTKLSKLDTLRLASTYIAHLRTVLRSEEGGCDVRGSHGHPITLTWPFTISNKPGSGDDSNASSSMGHTRADVTHPQSACHDYPPCEYTVHPKNYPDLGGGREVHYAHYTAH